MTQRRLLATASIATSMLVVTGCGIDTEKAGRDAAGNTTPVPTTPAARTGSSGATGPRRPAPLPSRGSGTLAVDAPNDALTDRLTNGFESASNTNLEIHRTNDSQAYADLCSGKADVIQSSFAPSAQDYSACGNRGLKVADPIELGADAIVLATRNESDVGGDCLTVGQARDIYRDGSPYSNWSQLGFENLPITTAGRQDGSQTFEFFGLEVLGLANPSLADVRSEYKAEDADLGVRDDVTGDARLHAADKLFATRAQAYRISVRPQRTKAINAALKQASATINAQVAQINARNKRLKIKVDGAALKRSNARLATQINKDAVFRAGYVFDAKVNARLAALKAQLEAAATRPGTIGAFNFSYYELFEARLRPMEIDFGTAEDQSGQPITFADLPAKDQVRLAAQIRSARGLPAVAASTPVRGASGSTGTTSVSDIDPDTPISDMNGLPARTVDGQRIFTGPNCVFPSQLTVANGSYPLTRRVLYITTTRALKRSETRDFLTYALQNASAAATALREIPITESQEADGLATVNGTKATGTTGATGSATGATGTSSAAGTSGGGGSTQAIPGIAVVGTGSTGTSTP